MRSCAGSLWFIYRKPELSTSWIAAPSISRAFLCGTKPVAFIVTRAKSNMDAQRIYSAPADRSAGIICGRTISLDGFDTHQGYPELLRRIRTKVPETGKTPVFIPNNFALPAATIKKRLDLDASIYALLQILSVTLFEKMTMHQALGGDENK